MKSASNGFPAPRAMPTCTASSGSASVWERSFSKKTAVLSRNGSRRGPSHNRYLLLGYPNLPPFRSLSRLFQTEPSNGRRVLRLQSADGLNRLTRASVVTLTETIRELASKDQPLIISGN